MLNERGVGFTYREYSQEPLSSDELRDVLDMLGMGPRDILRSRDAKSLEIDPDLDDDALIDAMAAHPTLIQRPIAVLDGRAAVGRPVENIFNVL